MKNPNSGYPAFYDAIEKQKPNWVSYKHNPDGGSLPYEMMPEGYPREEVRAIALEGSDLTLEGFPAFAVGDTVTVTVDGVKHSLVAFDDGGYPMIGDYSADIESGEGSFGWQIWFEETGVFFYSNDDHTVSYPIVAAVPMDMKFLPNFSKKPFLMWNIMDGEMQANMSFEEAFDSIVSGVTPMYIQYYNDFSRNGIVWFYVGGYLNEERKEINLKFANPSNPDAVPYEFNYTPDGWY